MAEGSEEEDDLGLRDLFPGVGRPSDIKADYITTIIYKGIKLGSEYSINIHTGQLGSNPTHYRFSTIIFNILKSVRQITT